jgi:hypothetical protein
LRYGVSNLPGRDHPRRDTRRGPVGIEITAYIDRMPETDEASVSGG